MSILTDAKDTLSLLQELQNIWRKKAFIFIIVIIEFVSYIKFAYKWIKTINFYHIEIWLLILLILFTYIAWLIVSKRLFFRDSWRIFYWVTPYLVLSAIFPLYIYPNKIKGNINIPYINIWGSIIIALILLFIFHIIKKRLFQDRRLIIVFTVTCNKNNIENKVRDSINHTILNIENQFEQIKIIVPPFGFKQSLRDCERYIKRPITQADGLIYAQLMDGNEDGNLGYIFTKFTSRINEQRHINFNRKNNVFLNNILEKQRISKEWNSFNISKTGALSKLKIAENLEGMLLMYCSALYMLKNDYTTALPIAKQMYNIEGINKHSFIYPQAANLLSKAYLASATKLEHERHDCDAAYNNIQECLKLFPNLIHNTWFLKSMARLFFYKNDVKASKKYTREFKKIEGETWGYYLNMGFYALYEGKIDEWISYYKKLAKFQPHKYEVKFAIEFLEYQSKNAHNHEYQSRLQYAITYLSIYVKPAKTQKDMRSIIKKNAKHKLDPRVEKLYIYALSNKMCCKD